MSSLVSAALCSGPVFRHLSHRVPHLRHLGAGVGESEWMEASNGSSLCVDGRVVSDVWPCTCQRRVAMTLETHATRSADVEAL